MSDDDANGGADDDQHLFRRSVADLKPLRREPRVPPSRPRVRPEAKFARADERAVLQESLEAEVEELEAGAGEQLRFHRASVGRRTFRKLSRGSYSVQAEIDLHGMTATEAREALGAFIADSAFAGLTCVRVIHGKGRGSGTRGPVLKRKVNHWLRRWEPVLAFVSARQADGGTGAVYVLLRRT